MKTLAILLLALTIASPAAVAKAVSFYTLQPTIYLNKSQNAPQMSQRALIAYNTSLSKHNFVGLGGLYGSVQPPEEEYGPARPFGKPRPKGTSRQARLPEYYVGVGGIANATPGVSADPCAQFQCKPGENVVANTASKKYYRCYCAAAKNIDPSIRKCFDTPKVAEKIGYTQGTC